MTIRHLLPATALEISALAECTVKQAHARLHSLLTKGAAHPTESKVPNGTTGTGPKHSRIWVLT